LAPGSFAWTKPNDEDIAVFQNLTNLVDMMKNVSRMRGELDRMRGELDRVIAEGSSGGGLVRVKVNGKHEVLECKIDPQILADKDPELLEDLIVAAANQAIEKAHEAAAEKMKQFVGELDSPEVKELIQKLGVKPRES
jgi:hypothetical protein